MNDILTMPDDEFREKFHTLGQEEEAVAQEEVQQEQVEDQLASQVEEPEQAAEEQPVSETVAEPATDTAAAEPTTTEQEVDYKAFYESLIGREFKAGGKMIKAQTAEEAFQLMQMGAGFHQNSQKLAKHRKYIATLEENGLLDDSKLNELIDISKNKPEAIAALVRRAGIEPHQLDTSGDAPTYSPDQHVLPDEVVQFRTSVDEIREQGGADFLKHVADDWDVTSRAELLKDPPALSMLYGHKQDGIYDKVSSEVERRKVFDPSFAKKPFLHAYLAVGQEMNEKGLLAPKQEPAAPAPTPVAVKPAVTSQPVAPNPAALKAASVRSTPTPASAVPNFLTMSDEEFKKYHMIK